MTTATELAVRMALDKPTYLPRYWFVYSTSWESSSARIAELAEDADIFLTSQGHHAIYYVGDFDVEISATGLSDFYSGDGDSDIDPRTGRPVIADVASLQEIVTCNASGLVVVDNRSWRNFTGVNDYVADFIEEEMKPVETPEHWGMHIYRWSVEGTSGTDGNTAIQPVNSICSS